MDKTYGGSGSKQKDTKVESQVLSTTWTMFYCTLNIRITNFVLDISILYCTVQCTSFRESGSIHKDDTCIQSQVLTWA